MVVNWNTKQKEYFLENSCFSQDYDCQYYPQSCYNTDPTEDSRSITAETMLVGFTSPTMMPIIYLLPADITTTTTAIPTTLINIVLSLMDWVR